MASPGPLTVRSGRVKHARRLATRSFRATEHEFLAEGPQAVREALAESGVVIEVFATVDASDRHPDLVARAGAADVEWHVVTDDVVAEVADSVTPQGLVARCRSIVRSLAELPADVGFVVVCADIRDPGNAGAVIRCADAAGADAVILAGDSVDPLNPKAVRASAGSLFHLPIVVHRDVAERSTSCGRAACRSSPPTRPASATSSTPESILCRRPPGCSATRRGDCRRTPRPGRQRGGRARSSGAPRA